MYSARFWPCVPMSPMHEEAPAIAGSVRHTACFMPSASSLVASQPCGYSTTTRLTAPNSSADTSSLASFTIG